MNNFHYYHYSLIFQITNKKKQFYNKYKNGGIDTMIINETYDEILERLNMYIEESAKKRSAIF